MGTLGAELGSEEQVASEESRQIQEDIPLEPELPEEILEPPELPEMQVEVDGNTCGQGVGAGLAGRAAGRTGCFKEAPQLIQV